MGLFQNLLDTYTKCQDIVGIISVDADGKPNEKKTLLPIFHTTFKSEICVYLDSQGNLLDITRDQEQTIIIPCTEASAGRSSGIASHSLCDQLDYVSGKNQAKFENYIQNLNKWKNFATYIAKQKLEAIHAYIIKKSIINDLLSRGFIKDSEFKDKDKKELDFEKIRKIGVRFQVEIPGDEVLGVWEDKHLRQSWIDYIKSQFVPQDNLFDYISGQKVISVASQHPKNIISSAGNAKLISCNDFSGFTFRGRFKEQNEAIIIDYEQSQKMHQALKWLINNYGLNLDTQSIIVWAIDKKPEPLITPYEDSMTLFNKLPIKATEEDLIEKAETEIYADYSKKLKKFLLGYGNEKYIKKHARKICIAIFDIATTGRMGLTFYQEFPEDTYLENIVNWHSESSYHRLVLIKEKDSNGQEKSKLINYIGAPSFDDILFAIYGKPRANNDKTYQMLKKKIRKQMLECMFGNFPFPKNIVEAAAIRASQPLSFTDKNNSFDPNDWQKAICISCSLIRKYYKLEESSMELEEKRTDRDYLYGRLLAIADRLEQEAMFKAEKSGQRATNSVRLMSAFAVKPYQTWGMLYHQILPYRIQLNGAHFFQQKINEVMALFKEGDYEDNRPLSPLYLLGYSAQSRAFFKKQDKEDN